MNILVSNHWLVSPGGTETFCYALIHELIRQGHTLEYFCLHRGAFAERMEKELGVAVASRTHYDLILANHHTTVEKLCRLGLVVQTCHGIYPELEQPSPFACGYVSISQEVQDHLLQLGYASRVIHNGIDCQRFKPVKPIQKENPRILSLCHSERAHQTVRQAAGLLGLSFGVLDKYQDQKWEVEQIINQYDLVVGLGRSAYEAMACGRPVIIYDDREYFEVAGDGYFLDSFPDSLRCNCSGRARGLKFTADSLAAEISKYRAEDGCVARHYALQCFNMETNARRYLAFAETVRAARQDRWRHAAELVMPLRVKQHLYKKRKFRSRKQS